MTDALPWERTEAEREEENRAHIQRWIDDLRSDPQGAYRRIREHAKEYRDDGLSDFHVPLFECAYPEINIDKLQTFDLSNIGNGDTEEYLIRGGSVLRKLHNGEALEWIDSYFAEKMISKMVPIDHGYKLLLELISEIYSVREKYNHWDVDDGSGLVFICAYPDNDKKKAERIVIGRAISELIKSRVMICVVERDNFFEYLLGDGVLDEYVEDNSHNLKFLYSGDSPSDWLFSNSDTIADDPSSSRLSSDAQRARGRPKGSSMQRADAPLVEEMRQLIASGMVPSWQKAAEAVADRATGTPVFENRVRRLMGRVAGEALPIPNARK